MAENLNLFHIPVILFFSLLLIFPYLSTSDPISLNYISILLPKRSPTQSHPVSVQLIGKSKHGCFKWETNSPHIVKIEPVSPDDNSKNNYNKITDKVSCPSGTSNSVIIYAEHSSSTDRKSAWVWAEDIISNHRAECEVFIDCISRLEILTSTRVINVGDTESLSVQAFDIADNVFTSVEGLPFRWFVSAEHLLSRVSLQQGLISVSNAQQELEEHGLGRMRTGRSDVTVALLDEHCEDKPVNSTTASFSMVEPLFLSPSIVNIPPFCEIFFSLHTRVRDSLTMHTRHILIPMPSNHYGWRSTNTSVVVQISDIKDSKIVLNNQPSGLTGFISKTIGTSKIIVTDVNVKQHHKEAEVYVNQPREISFVMYLVESHDNSSRVSRKCGEHILISGHQYILNIELYDRNGRLLDLCSGIVFDFKYQFEGSSDGIDPVDVKVIDKDNNNNKFLFTANKVGFMNFSVSLDQISVISGGSRKAIHKYQTPFVLSKRFQVITKIQVKPQQTLLPLYYKSHTAKLIATGGTGHYEWISDVLQIADINQDGVISTTDDSGSGLITVFDRCAPENNDNTLVIVSQPSLLNFIPGIREFQSEKQYEIVLTVSDKQGRAFSNCNNIELSVELKGSQGKYDNLISSSQCYSSCPRNTGKINRSCWILTITSPSEVGFYTLIAKINNLSDRVASSTRISVYNMISLLDSVPNNNLIIAKDSKRCISWRGGPLKWPDTEYHYQKLVQSDISNKLIENLTITDIDSTDSDHSVSIYCKEITQQNLSISVSNSPSPLNPYPVTNLYNITINCYPPLLMYPRSLTIGISNTESSKISFEIDHPLKENITFYTDDITVAHVDASGNIYGKKLGKTFLHALIETPANNCREKEDGLHDIIPVVVQFQGFIIKSPSNRIVEGQSICFYIEAVSGNIPFDPSFSSVECVWTADSNSVLLHPTLQTHNTDNNVIVNGYSACITGIHRGKVTITAKITTNKPLISIFEQKLDINVFTPLTITSPVPFYHSISSSIILCPYLSRFLIKTSMDSFSESNIHYKIIPVGKYLDIPVISYDKNLLSITVNSNGLVSSTNITGDSILYVYDITTLQSTSVLIALRSVSSVDIISPLVLYSTGLFLDEKNKKKNKTEISESRVYDTIICSSKNFTIDVILRDELGRKFSIVQSLSLTSMTSSAIASVVAISNNNSVISVDQISHHDSNRINDQHTHGILAKLRLSSYLKGSAVVKIGVIGHNIKVNPLFIKIIVINGTECSYPTGVRLSIHLKNDDFFQENIINTEKRLELENDIKDEIISSLNIPSKRIALVSIDPKDGCIVFDILPHERPFPLSLAESFKSKLLDISSKLRSGRVFSHYDDIHDVIISSCPDASITSSAIWIYEKTEEISDMKKNSFQVFFLDIFEYINEVSSTIILTISIIFGSLFILYIYSFYNYDQNKIPTPNYPFIPPKAEITQSHNSTFYNPLELSNIGPGFLSKQYKTSRFYDTDHTASSVSFSHNM